MLILNIINYVKIQVIMMQDNLMLLIIKAFSSFKFTFIISLFYMKLYKLSIEFATKTKKNQKIYPIPKSTRKTETGTAVIYIYFVPDMLSVYTIYVVILHIIVTSSKICHG